MTRAVRSIREWDPSPRVERWIARTALVCALIGGSVAVAAFSGLADAQTKIRVQQNNLDRQQVALKEQQRKTDRIAKQAQQTAALACWRSKVGGPIIADMYARLDVFADPELFAWYVGAIPTKCASLPEHLLPPKKYR